MSYILSAQRELNVVRAFQKYRQYLEQAKSVFAVSAFELATADWYFDPKDHRCPHDARLQQLVVSESSTSDGNSSVSAKVILQSAHRDMILEFHYPKVFGYDCVLSDASTGHRDWLYDEFRLSDSGNVVHEIEWSGPEQLGRWLIEASDVLLHVKPVTNKDMFGGGS